MPANPSSFYRQRTWKPQRLRQLPKVIKLVICGARVRICTFSLLDKRADSKAFLSLAFHLKTSSATFLSVLSSWCSPNAVTCFVSKHPSGLPLIMQACPVKFPVSALLAVLSFFGHYFSFRNHHITHRYTSLTIKDSNSAHVYKMWKVPCTKITHKNNSVWLFQFFFSPVNT